MADHAHDGRNPTAGLNMRPPNRHIAAAGHLDPASPHAPARAMLARGKDATAEAFTGLTASTVQPRPGLFPLHRTGASAGTDDRRGRRVPGGALYRGRTRHGAIPDR